MVTPRLLFVSHEASRSGAPMMLLYFVRWLRENTSARIQVVFVSGGALVDDFKQVAHRVDVLGDSANRRGERLLRRLAWGDPLASPSPTGSVSEQTLRGAARSLALTALHRHIHAAGAPDLIYLNSAGSAQALGVLSDEVPVISHVHEAAWTLAWLRDAHPAATQRMLSRTRRFIAAADVVKQGLVDVLEVDPGLVDVCHEAIPVNETPPSEEAVRAVRSELGISETTTVVGCVAALHWRKGPDLFLQVAKRVLAKTPDSDVVFVWLGAAHANKLIERELEHDLVQGGLQDRVRFIGARVDPSPYVGLFDVFVLTSREDPFPLSCLEAAAMSKPVVCFDAGGMTELIEPEERLVAPYLDIESMASRIVELLASPAEREALGAALASRVKQRHGIENTAPRLFEIIDQVLAATRPCSVLVSRRGKDGAPRDGGEQADCRRKPTVE